MKKNAQSRHGKRAVGKTQTSISLRVDLLEQAREAAEADNRSFSNWLENLLQEKLEEADREGEDAAGEGDASSQRRKKASKRKAPGARKG